MKQLILISACIAASLCATAQERCVKTVVNMKGDQMTLTTSGAKKTTLQQNFIYYERKRHRKHDETYAIPGVAASNNPSKPLLLSTQRDVAPVPEKYKVAVSAAENNITACNDSEANLATNLNVERVNSYTGNYPGTSVDPCYEEVSKHKYKMAAKKIRKIERKEEKIARRAEVNVGVKSTTE